MKERLTGLPPEETRGASYSGLPIDSRRLATVAELDSLPTVFLSSCALVVCSVGVVFLSRGAINYHQVRSSNLLVVVRPIMLYFEDDTDLLAFSWADCISIAVMPLTI